MEQRKAIVCQMETRESEDGKRTITGYAVKWEMKSDEMGNFSRFKEQFRRGAFAESLSKDNQLALWSHDTSKVLGTTKNNTLRLLEDDIGLRFELDLPNTTLGLDTYETIRRGDVDGVSFGFKVNSRGQSWDERDKNNIVRTIVNAKLLEISPVAFPAYPDSEVVARSKDPYKLYKKINERRKKLILKTYY